MALKHLILNPDESANLWRDWRHKRSYALWGVIPFKSNEVLFVQLAELPKAWLGMLLSGMLCSAPQQQRYCRAPQEQLLSLLNPSPDSGIRGPRSSVSLPTIVSLWNMHLNRENWSASLLLDTWSNKGNPNRITQLEMPLNSASETSEDTNTVCIEDAH